MLYYVNSPPQEVIPTFDMAVNELFFERFPDSILEHQIQVRPYNALKTRNMRTLNPEGKCISGAPASETYTDGLSHVRSESHSFRLLQSLERNPAMIFTVMSVIRVSSVIG